VYASPRSVRREHDTVSFRELWPGVIMPARLGVCGLMEFSAHVGGKLTAGDAAAPKIQRSDGK
jgi:hypothetical protein